MVQHEAQIGANAHSLNGAGGLEGRLRHLFGEQQRLRELLDRMRGELDSVNAALFRLQDEFCTDAVRQEEYDSARPPYRAALTLDQAAARTAGEFGRYVEAVAPWRGAGTPAAELAAYVLRSATVRPARGICPSRRTASRPSPKISGTAGPVGCSRCGSPRR